MDASDIIVLDMLGLVLRVLVTAASVPEREGAKIVLNRVHRMGDKVKRLHTIWMDGGYRGEDFTLRGDGYVSLDCGNCS